MRRALGASPSRLMRQFITEGLLLVSGGGALGVGLANWTMQLLASAGSGRHGGAACRSCRGWD